MVEPELASGYAIVDADESCDCDAGVLGGGPGWLHNPGRISPTPSASLSEPRERERERGRTAGVSGGTSGGPDGGIGSSEAELSDWFLDLDRDLDPRAPAEGAGGGGGGAGGSTGTVEAIDGSSTEMDAEPGTGRAVQG